MIGVSSTEFSAYQIEEVLEEVSKVFKHWEIFAEAEHNLNDVTARLAMIKDSYKMTFSIHAPICDINIASLNERIREASTLEIMTIMEYAVKLNVKTITVHPGLYSMAVPYQEERSIAAAKKSLRILDRITSEYGITIAIENMPEFQFMLGQTAEEMKELLDGTDLNVCFDIGHANTTNQIDEIIDALGDRFANIHVHDNMGERDEHKTVGEGNIDFKKALMRFPKYNGNLIIEAKSFQSAVESKERLEKMFS
ncbi:MAG: sugar phosphate isomerase/epimerase family protein [Bacteroidales bacterium]|jgi:sugar phosphate isomerase/epimerase